MSGGIFDKDNLGGGDHDLDHDEVESDLGEGTSYVRPGRNAPPPPPGRSLHEVYVRLCETQLRGFNELFMPPPAPLPGDVSLLGLVSEKQLYGLGAAGPIFTGEDRDMWQGEGEKVLRDHDEIVQMWRDLRKLSAIVSKLCAAVPSVGTAPFAETDVPSVDEHPLPEVPSDNTKVSP